MLLYKNVPKAHPYNKNSLKNQKENLVPTNATKNSIFARKTIKNSL
jgi:hypothetical protein